MSENWEQVKEILASALEQNPAERSGFVRQACGENDALRAEVESLLQDHDFADTLLENSPVTPGALSWRAQEMIGKRIGAYRIIGKCGQGGMAVVYLGERDDQHYRKRVAIKMVSHASGNETILQRFRNERQTLAALDHPNIVKLLDGGSTEDGLPYLVMDFVDGVPIDEYCDSHRLSTTERLQLFRTVCAAVHFAHRNQVIHRDLKPANILVTSEGVPKLLDFGIAKLLNVEFSSQTLLVTRTGLQPMTPEYASPEQVRGDPLTNATDIYSLGVLLYKLLTGHRPYRLKRQTPLEIERVICEEDPEKPSTAISRVEEITSSDGSTITITPELVSRTREGRPEELRRRLCGDLDTIVLMALRKEPQRRYPSVEQFSEDIRRHLESLPVTARPATF